MLITLMLSVVAMKSRSFFSLRCSANKQVGGSWEGAQPGSEPKLSHGNIPYHGRHAQLMLGGWLGEEGICFSHFHKFESSLVWEFGLFQEFCNICKIHKFGVPPSLPEHWLQIRCWVARKWYCI